VPNLAHLAERAQELHVFFNNNRADYAVRNARSLSRMLVSGLENVVVVQPPAPDDQLPS
jgi:uncharacterized protein YecE (DUF72 family)